MHSKQRGGNAMRVYSQAYSEAYNKALMEWWNGGCVQPSSKSDPSGIRHGSNAGSPDMKRMESKEVSDELKKKVERGGGVVEETGP
jgi:hypothetical protein